MKLSDEVLGRRVDEGIPRIPARKAFQVPVQWPRELWDPKIRHRVLTCPVCGRVREFNPSIDPQYPTLICNYCQHVWYRGRRYRMKAWDQKWERKVKKNLMSVKR